MSPAVKWDLDTSSFVPVYFPSGLKDESQDDNDESGDNIDPYVPFVVIISYFMPFMVIVITILILLSSGSGMIWHLSLQSTILHIDSEEVTSDKSLIDSWIFQMVY